MTDTTRYAKTEKGAAEIRSRGQNLRGRLRTMLILVDPSKTGDELRASAAQLGVETDFLAIARARRLYRRRCGIGQRHGRARRLAWLRQDELARFRAAKAFINETIVDALGVRAFLFTLKLERCSTRDGARPAPAGLREGDRGNSAARPRPA